MVLLVVTECPTQCLFQLAPSGRMDLAAHRSVSACSRTHLSAIDVMEHVCANLAIRARPATWVSSGGAIHLADLCVASVFYLLFFVFLECDSGYYGPGCKSKCQCPAGVSCHHMTGQCQRQCPAGVYGDHCDQGELK